MVSYPLARPKRLGNSFVWLESSKGDILITMGPHWPGVLAVVAMILGGTWMTFSIIEGIPVSRFWLGIFFKCTTIVFCVSTIAALMMTACSDPGIVRMTPTSDEEIEEDMDSMTFCEVCEIHQPDKLLIRHCQECGLCIMGHDHHCPWMGKCVGQKNMR